MGRLVLAPCCLLLVLGGCRGARERRAPDVEGPAPRLERRSTAPVSSRDTSVPRVADAGAASSLPPPPWAGPPIPATRLPPVFLAEWRKADNRSSCPLLVPTVVLTGARPRAATFYGGWAVAYDRKGLPGSWPSGGDCPRCGRSVFGIAGTGAEKGGPMPFEHRIRYRDGSEVGWDAGGGRRGRAVAYITLPDASCLYNAWSALGPAHLQEIVGGLRRVAGAR